MHTWFFLIVAACFVSNLSVILLLKRHLRKLSAFAAENTTKVLPLALAKETRNLVGGGSLINGLIIASIAAFAPRVEMNPFWVSMFGPAALGAIWFFAAMHADRVVQMIKSAEKK